MLLGSLSACTANTSLEEVPGEEEKSGQGGLLAPSACTPGDQQLDQNNPQGLPGLCVTVAQGGTEVLVHDFSASKCHTEKTLESLTPARDKPAAVSFVSRRLAVVACKTCKTGSTGCEVHAKVVPIEAMTSVDRPMPDQGEVASADTSSSPSD